MADDWAARADTLAAFAASGAATTRVVCNFVAARVRESTQDSDGGVAALLLPSYPNLAAGSPARRRPRGR